MIGYLSVVPISRGVGRSATAAAAYRAAIVVDDQRTGERHDYKRRSGVAWSGIVGWKHSAAHLANTIEAAERRKDAKVARDVVVALPADATLEQRRELAEGYARWLFERHRTPAVVAIHSPGRGGDARNWHAHLLLATRITADGETLGAKARELDTAKTSGRHIEAWRAEWGRRIDMDMRSHARRGTGMAPEAKAPKRSQREAMRAQRRQAESLRALIAKAENQIAGMDAAEFAAREAEQREIREAAARRERAVSLRDHIEYLGLLLDQARAVPSSVPTRDDVRASEVTQLEWKRAQALERLPRWRHKWALLHSFGLREISRDLDAWRAMKPPVRARLKRMHAELVDQARTQREIRQARVVELESEIARGHLELAELDPPTPLAPTSHLNMAGQRGRVRSSPGGRRGGGLTHHEQEEDQHVQQDHSGTAPRM